MKRGLTLSLLALTASAAALSGCSSANDSNASLAANQPMTVPTTPARSRGLMYASDNLGNAVFAESTPAMASVPERD